jgi:acyl carrier protein phosphodiesterase
LNYLAHVYLSGSEPELMIGNFIADAVRGKQVLLYPEKVQQGIYLHRQIDAFTDSHQVVAQTKARLRPAYGKYAPVIADMYYDHFLAANFKQVSGLDLQPFTEKTYSILQANFEDLPERVQQFLPHMIRHNWLLSYSQLSGIHQALSGLSRRTSFESGMETAARELEENYPLYEADFNRFFPKLLEFTNNWLSQNANSGSLP